MRILLKRACRRLLVFLLLLVVPMLAVRVSTAETPPPAGFYLPEETPSAERIREYLQDNGFVSRDDPESLLEQVRLGELDSGVVFPKDFSQRLSQGQLEESIKFFSSPSSFSPELYKSHVAAIVFREYVPYICASAFAETELTQEAVLEKYEAMFAGGYAFSFDVVTANGEPGDETGKNRNMALGATAILTCAALFLLAAETADGSVKQLLPRLGLKRSITRVLLPETAVNLLLSAAFSGGGLALAGLPEMWLPTALYCAAMWGWGLLLYGILWSAKQIYVLLPVLVIASAALCPIYTDLRILLPWLKSVRMVLPTYWLWCIPNDIGLWIAVSMGIITAGIGLIALRCRVLKYK